jgi:tartrate dehydratase alpha subunit/fumarate hydratase class I-like protein
MTLHYTIGMTIGGKSQHVTVEAEDALIAALKVKHRNPEAAINYVRKTNTRGDRRHPHMDIAERRPI